jgi:pSer/pThr/pTyr-binding forkhead associated (FHA) protein
MGSTNGVVVNDSPVRVAELKHGDRFKLGEHTFQYIVEPKEPTLRTYNIPES